MSGPGGFLSNLSWFERLRSSFAGVLVGLLLMVIALPMLWFNEGRAVKRAKSLKEGSGAVVAVDHGQVDGANEGKLVHVSGPATTTVALVDEVFGVTQQGLRLVREVEMYQWRENSRAGSSSQEEGSDEKTKSGKRYGYEKVWSDSLIRSAEFDHVEGHENPTQMRYRAEKWLAGDAMLGAFRLPVGLVEKVPGMEKLWVTEGDVTWEGGDVKFADGMVYLGASVTEPKVGDLRVGWSVVRTGEVSVVAKQVGGSFSPYGTRSGSDVELVERGRLSAEAMFTRAEEQNKTLTWGMRFAGFLMMFGGVALVFRPLAVVGHLIPLVGRLMDAGLTLFAGVMAAVVSLLVMALAWIAYRPVLAVLLILCALGLLYGATKYFEKHGPPKLIG
ncbi:hypothetical protein FEM03_21065 [Phragmitibacter flavus]|uniref:Uncharacterized protein n=1 Tax=Phragmitibacter flavus TaxID=2576071 RepID=A0A5R8K937_9BACT|nr:TMEM43 family protein [Phragmitibacter flavus]TLD68826.1 hypothetical protein FEM03_21065 [Phragmitibacter flavus]